MKRLAWLGLGTVGCALILGFLLRHDATEESAASHAPPPPAPVARAEVELKGEGMVPYKVQVPRDHEIHLRVHGAPDAPDGLLVLTGYEDVVAPVDMGPGLSRDIVFLSSRPGDDFALSLGGVILGRVEVTGSHLVEGHQ